MVSMVEILYMKLLLMAKIQQYNWQSFSFEEIKPIPRKKKTPSREKWRRNLLNWRSHSGSSQSLIMAIFIKGTLVQGLPLGTIDWTGP